MQKFILSFILLSTSITFASTASDIAELKELQEVLMRQLQIQAESLRQATNPAVGKIQVPLQVPTVATNPVEGFIIAHPWYSVIGVAVFTFAAIKTWDHLSKSNKNNEDLNSGN